jgi:hypothetical protein
VANLPANGRRLEAQRGWGLAGYVPRGSAHSPLILIRFFPGSLAFLT